MQPSPFPLTINPQSSPLTSPSSLYLPGPDSLTGGISSIIKSLYHRYKCLLKTLYGPLRKLEGDQLLPSLSVLCCEPSCPLPSDETSFYDVTSSL